VCHTFHSTTGQLANGSTAAARWVTGMIAEALASPCPNPVAIAVTGWAADPYAAGAYTRMCLLVLPMRTSICSAHPR
jgi:hypothetical protein